MNLQVKVISDTVISSLAKGIFCNSTDEDIEELVKSYIYKGTPATDENFREFGVKPNGKYLYRVMRLEWTSLLFAISGNTVCGIFYKFKSNKSNQNWR